MSNTSGRHPVRTLLILTVLAVTVVVVRHAVADKGGVYDPADAS
jgi:hypothetical protein